MPLLIPQRPDDTINPVSDTDAAYIAGLIDGEGTVTLTRKHRNENRQACVSISNTERDLLEFVKLATGFGKITGKRTTSNRHTKSFTYAVHNRQALRLLERILPWLKSYKRERANLIVQHYVRLTPRNGKYSRQAKRLRLRFEQAVLAIKPNHPSTDTSSQNSKG